MKEPFATLLRGDLKAVLAGGERSIVPIVMATHAGMTTQEFEQAVTEWVGTARHPKTKRLYTEMVYQPMLDPIYSVQGHLIYEFAPAFWAAFNAPTTRAGARPSTVRRVSSWRTYVWA